MKITFFGHDADDAMLHRRVMQMRALGHEVRLLTMLRSDRLALPPALSDVEAHVIGSARDGAMLHRLGSVAQAARQAQKLSKEPAPDLYWARNLDMLAIAVAARAPARPLVYECLDIHGAVSAPTPMGAVMRTAERALLRRCAALVISAPDYVPAHFARYGEALPPVALIENRVDADAMPPRPTFRPRTEKRAALTIGWVGILRCRRSLDLLTMAAGALGGAVRIRLHGRPSLAAIPDFAARIAAAPFLDYCGPYRAPDDLARVYDGLDAVWAGDYLLAAGSSRWSLTNRLYEGGYFGIPALAPAGSATAAFIARHGTGRVVPVPEEDGLITTLRWLLEGENAADLRAATLGVDASVFAAGPAPVADALALALSRRKTPGVTGSAAC